MRDSRNFSTADITGIERDSFVSRVEYHGSLDSTNNLALELANSEHVPLPLLVLTDQQTAGRGRGSNQWWAAHGALTFSVVLETAQQQLPPKCWPRVSLTVGLAICEALLQIAPQADLGIKWPNDVYLDGRKLCGVLVEVPGGRMDRLVLGVGINVNNSFATAPEQLRPIATSLYDSTGQTWHLPQVLTEVLGRLESRVRDVAAVDATVTESWRERCMLTGCRIRLKMGRQSVTGVCRGIDEDGALMIDTVDGTQRHFAGVIELLA